jgi:protein O-GlcNAc transferase
MPTVETSRLKVMNWDTDAFHEKNLNKYFVLVHKTLAGDEFDLVPADSHLFASNPNGFTCFETAHFGVPSVGYPNPEIVPEFTNFIRQRLGLTSLPPPNIPRVGLITRATRRRITNEDELIAAISPIVEAERIEFSGMTFKEQVKAVQRFTVLVGMNGAGLMNAIYLPEGAVAIQLAPYNATQLNVNEFGKVLKSRGPYMEWRNTHAEKSSSTREADPFNSQADSEVDVAEFIELIQEALRTGINRKLKQDL